MTRSFQQITNFVRGEISPRLFGRTGSDSYQNGAGYLENFIVHAQGGVERRQGLQEIGVLGFESIVIPFRQETDDLCVMVSSNALRVYDGLTLVQAIPSPYIESDLDTLYWAQDENLLEICCDRVRPYQLIRSGATWSFEPAQYDAVPQFSFADADSPAGQDQSFTVTFGDIWSPGDSCTLRVNGNETAVIPYFSIGSVMETVLANVIRPFLYDLGNGLGFENLTVTEASPDVYTVTLVGVGGSLPFTLSAGLVNGSGTLTVAAGSPGGSGSGGLEDAWSDDRGWPRTVVFHEQRKIYGGTRSLPATLWGSASGNTEVFTIGQNDGDPFTFRLKGRKPHAITWLSSKRLLAVGTTGGTSVQFAVPLTPTNVQFDRQNADQSASIPPVEANSDTLYVLRGQRKVQNLLYDFGAQGWRAVDVTFPAEHITAGRIRAMDWTAEPDGVLWCVLEDGAAVAMTFDQAQEVVAWHRHRASGSSSEQAFRSVAVVHRNGVDEVWFVVLDGIFWRLVRLPATSTDEPAGAAWLDLWERVVMPEETNVATGFSRHNGREVRVLVDGADAGLHVMSDGQVTTEDTGTVFDIGFDYSATVRTNANEGGTFGTAQVAKRRFARVVLRLLNSALPLVNGERPADRDEGGTMDEPPELLSEDVDASGTEYDDGSVEIIADKPAPCHITGLYGVLKVGQG